MREEMGDRVQGRQIIRLQLRGVQREIDPLGMGEVYASLKAGVEDDTRKGWVGRCYSVAINTFESHDIHGS